MYSFNSIIALATIVPPVVAKPTLAAAYSPDRIHDDQSSRPSTIEEAENEKLILLQYPNKPVFMNQPVITTAKYRPKHERLEVTISNNNDSSNDNNNNNNTELIMRSSKISSESNKSLKKL